MSNINIIIIMIIIMILYVLRFSFYENFEDVNMFPHIFYININKSKDRNNRFRSRLENTPYVLRRIEAITPETLNNKVIKLPEHCKSLTNEELSCSLSHLKAIHTAYHAKLKYALIMEDDIYFMKHPDWKALINSAPRNWEILQLFTFDTSVYNKDELTWEEHEENMYSGGAYVINLIGMEKLLKQFVPEYKKENWDEISTINFEDVLVECVADFFIYYHLKTYIYLDILFNTEGIDSEIHPGHLPSHREGIKRLNEVLLKKMK